MSYQDSVGRRLLQHFDYLEKRYGSVHNAPPEERERLVDYAVDLAKVSLEKEK